MELGGMDCATLPPRAGMRSASSTTSIAATVVHGSRWRRLRDAEGERRGEGGRWEAGGRRCRVVFSQFWNKNRKKGSDVGLALALGVRVIRVG